MRCLACKSPRGARIACLIGGLFVFFIGVPFSFLGSITRYAFAIFNDIAILLRCDKLKITQYLSFFFSGTTTVPIQFTQNILPIHVQLYLDYQHVVNGCLIHKHFLS